MRESSIYAFMFLLWRYGIQQFYKDIAPHTFHRFKGWYRPTTKAVFEDARRFWFAWTTFWMEAWCKTVRKTITVWKAAWADGCVGKDHQGVFWSGQLVAPFSNFFKRLIQMHRVHFHKQTRTKEQVQLPGKRYKQERYDSIKEANYQKDSTSCEAKEIRGWEHQVKDRPESKQWKHICNCPTVTSRWSLKKDEGISFREVKGSVLTLFYWVETVWSSCWRECARELNW